MRGDRRPMVAGATSVDDVAGMLVDKKLKADASSPVASAIAADNGSSVWAW